MAAAAAREGVAGGRRTGGEREALGRQSGTSRAGTSRFCRVSVTLSLLLLPSSLLSLSRQDKLFSVGCLVAPMIVLSSFNGPFFRDTRDSRTLGRDVSLFFVSSALSINYFTRGKERERDGKRRRRDAFGYDAS